MYNLAHTYLFDETIKHDLNKSIELLIKSSDFFYSIVLLCIVLVKQFGFNLGIIKKNIENRINKNDKKNIDLELILNNVDSLKRMDMPHIDLLYESYRELVFLYDVELEPIRIDSHFTGQPKVYPKYPNAKNITSDFYDGFENGN